jgi:hypothetical protein
LTVNAFNCATLCATLPTILDEMVNKVDIARLFATSQALPSTFRHIIDEET